METNQFSVRITPLESPSEIEKEWLDLELESNCSFFLSWGWISAWLESFDPVCQVIRVYECQNLIAMALMTQSRSSKWNRFPSSRLHFQQLGNPVCDQIWTEYNGLLVSDGYRVSAVKAVLNYLLSSKPDWDEIVLGAITEEEAVVWEESSGLARHDLWQSPAYGIDLQSVAKNYANYLSSLSQNTRYQIRKSLKLYAAGSGDLELVPAKTEAEALGYLEQVAPVHIARWGNDLGQSGFANSGFVKFHQNLIKNAWSTNQIDFIKLISGSRVLGYFYNFVYRGTVYFYLSGLCSEQNAKLKPGLSGHALCIQKYMDQGYLYYDFMGGDDRYKASLGKKHCELYQITLQRDRLKFKIEHGLRKIKQSVKS